MFLLILVNSVVISVHICPTFISLIFVYCLCLLADLFLLLVCCGFDYASCLVFAYVLRWFIVCFEFADFRVAVFV